MSSGRSGSGEPTSLIGAPIRGAVPRLPLSMFPPTIITAPTSADASPNPASTVVTTFKGLRSGKRVSASSAPSGRPTREATVTAARLNLRLGTTLPNSRGILPVTEFQ
jgi:hypothetical protein